MSCTLDAQKPISQSVGEAAAATGRPHSRLLYAFKLNSEFNFLIYTGAGVSVIPPETDRLDLQIAHFSLQAANGTKIPTYGQKLLTLNLGLRRAFPFLFTIAGVEQPHQNNRILSCSQ